MLSESHISVHTYPEENSFFMDIFTCGNKNPEIICKEVEKYFEKNNISEVKFDKKILRRGK